MKIKQTWYKVLLIGLLTACGVFIPEIIANNGLITVYNDYYTALIPFQIAMARAIHEGTNGWLSCVDLGSELVGSMAHFGIGSPFTWICWLVPYRLIPYAMQYSLILKYAFATLTAYLYFKHHKISDTYATIGGILYAFSGYQATNLIFYSYHDAIVFFPILLIELDKVIDGEKNRFAIAVMLCAMVDFYLFPEEVLFAVIYFLCRVDYKKIKEVPKKIALCIIGGITGTLMAAWILYPTINTLLGNPRLGAKIARKDWINLDRRYFLQLFRVFCFPADTMGSQSCVVDCEFSSWSAYIPMFGMLLVIAFLILNIKKRDWLWRLLVILLVFAVTPVLNSSFGMFADSNYKRWYFMLILMKVFASVKVLESIKLASKAKWIVLVITLIMGLSIPAFLWWSENKFEIIYRQEQFIALSLIGVISGIVIFIILFLIKKWYFQYVCLAFTIAFAIITTGYSLHDYNSQTIEASTDYMLRVNAYNDIKEYIEDGYRIDTGENTVTFINDINGSKSFDDVICGSIFEFYDSLGIERKVYSPDGPEGTDRLLSAKYFLSTKQDEEGTILATLNTPITEYLYEKNEDIKPIGFPLDFVIRKSEFDKIDDELKAKVMEKVCVISDDFKLNNNFAEINQNEAIELTKTELDKSDKIYDINYCKDKNAVYSEKIEANQNSILFISIPYDKGFSVENNGTKQEIIKSNGMMAIEINEGINEIVVRYVDKAFFEGVLLSLLGVFLYIENRNVVNIITRILKTCLDAKSSELC